MIDFSNHPYIRPQGVKHGLYTKLCLMQSGWWILLCYKMLSDIAVLITSKYISLQLTMSYTEEKDKISILQVDEKMFSYNKHKKPWMISAWNFLWIFSGISDVSVASYRCVLIFKCRKGKAFFHLNFSWIFLAQIFKKQGPWI